MRPTARITIVLAAILVAGLAAAPAAAADPPPPPSAVTSIAAVGDSITQAASSGGSLGTDYPANSWSTGTNSTVKSHLLRLQSAGAQIGANVFNRSVSGAKVADLNAQMATVVPLQPTYLTVLIGGNDLCTDTVAQMTSVADFRTSFEAAMATITAGSSSTRIYVVSIPNAYQLWQLFRNDFWARTVWALGDICQSLLANPTSTQTADVQRREQVRQRNVAFNAELAAVCAIHAHCRFDGNAVFNTAFARSDVSGDYFHPSIAGQAKLAQVSWTAGFWATVGAPTVHLGGLTGASTARKGGWTATVTATALNGSNAPVANAVVSGSWTGGTAATCTTNTQGTCSMSLAVGRKTTTVTWTLVSIAATGSVYDPAANVATTVTLGAP